MNKLRDSSFMDPMIGLKDTFPETRKSYAFHLAFKALKAADLSQDFIDKIKNKLSHSIIQNFETLKCPKLSEYLYLYQIIASYFIEPLKKYRCQYNMDYFSAMRSLLNVSNDIEFITNNINYDYLIYAFLDIRNVLNGPNHIKNKKLSKLYHFGMDQNIVKIEKDYDFDEIYNLKLCIFDDITQQISDYDDDLFQIDVYLLILYQILNKNIKVNNFYAVYTEIYAKINEIAKSHNKSQS